MIKIVFNYEELAVKQGFAITGAQAIIFASVNGCEIKQNDLNQILN